MPEIKDPLVFADGTSQTSAGLVNPMTTQDDLIIGGASGAPARLAKGTGAYVLRVNPLSGHLEWVSPPWITSQLTAKGQLLGYTGSAYIASGIGSDGQVLQADSTQSAGVGWTGYPEAHAWTAGTFLYPACNSGTTGRAPGEMLLQPLVIWQTTAVDQILVEVTTLAATTNARLGIYRTGTDGYPGALLLDAGTVAATSTGVKSITISLTLAPGLYWLAAVAQGTNNPAFRSNNGHLPGVQADTSAHAFQPLTSGMNGYKITGVSGALPDPAGTISTVEASSTRVCLRVA